MNVAVAGGDEAFEQGVGLVWFALKFRMKLAGDKKRMILEFDHLYQLAVRRGAAEDEARFFKLRPVVVVEFVAMPMPLVNYEGAV